MNPTHLHLVVNHFSLVLVFAGLAVMQWASFAAQPQALKVGLALLAAAGAFALPAFLSGEPAEHAMEKLLPAAERLMERHEEAAEPAFWAMLAVGAFAAWALWRYRGRETPVYHVRLAAAGAFLALALLARASYLGGQIRHPELDPGTSVAPEGAGALDGSARTQESEPPDRGSP